MVVYASSGKDFGAVGYVTSQEVQRTQGVEGALQSIGLGSAAAEGTALGGALETVGLQTRRVSEVQYRNLLSRDPGRAAREMQVTANQAARADVVRRSFAMSYHPNENLTDEEVIADADLFRQKMGLEAHQAVIAVHRDRAHVHAHVVVCAVHPETYELWDSSYERLRGQRALREIEQEQGRLPLEEAKGSEKAQGSEKPQSSEEGKEGDSGTIPDWRLRKSKADREVPFRKKDLRRAHELLRATDGDEIRTCPELQRSFAREGLELRMRGRGGVLVDANGNEAPLSRIDRSYSLPKLEEKLEGEFRPPEEVQPCRETASEETASEETASEETASEETASEEVPNEEAAGEETVSESVGRRDGERRDGDRSDRERAPEEDSETGRSSSTDEDHSSSRVSSGEASSEGASSGRAPSGRAPSGRASSVEPSGQASWHEVCARVRRWNRVRACAEEVAREEGAREEGAGEEGAGEEGAREEAESRAVRMRLFRAVEDYVSGEVSREVSGTVLGSRVAERAEEAVEDALGRRPVGEQETEVITDAARAVRGANEPGRWALAQWATGVELNQNQEKLLDSWRRTVPPGVGAEIEPPEVKIAPESRAQFRSRGRIRARVARLSEEEADEVEATIETRAAVAPNERARRKAEAKLEALRRERQRVPEGRQALTPDQEKVVVGVIWLDSARRQGGREVGKQDGGTYGGTYKDYMSDVQGQLRDMEVGGTDDLRGLLRESERRVLEDQIYLAGADPEVRKAFGPGAPSEQQREIYRQAREVAMCSHYKSEPTGMGDRPREEWPGRWERKTRAELVRTMRDKAMRDGSVREEVRELSQMDGPVADAIEQAWEASRDPAVGAAWVAGTSLTDRQERALRAADPGRDLDWGVDRASPKGRLKRIRRPELRATLAGLSGPELQALRRVVKAWPKVCVISRREEEARRAKDAVLEVLEERSRPDSRPDGRPPQAPGKSPSKAPGKLDEPQEMALAEVYRLEELVEKKLVEEGAAEDEIRDEIRGLGGPEKPCGSGSGPAERSITGLRGQVRDLSSEEIEDLETHLKGEEIAKQLLARGVDLAREAKRREELRAKVRETTETALEKTRQRLQGGERVEAARVLREAQATLNDLANEAPEFFGPEVEKRLERRLKESLGEPDYRELRRGLAEADVEDGRAERGDPEAARALSGPQREAAGSLEKAARFATIPESGAERKSNLREAAQAMAGMSEEERSQIRRAASPEAQEAFKTAQGRAEELRSDRSEKTEQKSRKTQSQKSQSRSRGRG